LLPANLTLRAWRTSQRQTSSRQALSRPDKCVPDALGSNYSWACWLSPASATVKACLYCTADQSAASVHAPPTCVSTHPSPRGRCLAAVHWRALPVGSSVEAAFQPANNLPPPLAANNLLPPPIHAGGLPGRLHHSHSAVDCCRVPELQPLPCKVCCRRSCAAAQAAVNVLCW
jgi:hypothetical protein